MTTDEKAQPRMSFSFTDKQGLPVQIPMEPGQIIFVLGANGAGKSSLLQKLYRDNRNHARRITAHRQTWFASSSSEVTPAARERMQSDIGNRDMQLEARWRDDYPSQRAGIALFDLVELENANAREIAKAARAGRSEKVEALTSREAPLAVLNRLLKLGNLPIEISLEDTTRQLIATRDGSDEYGIAELSDGERNALLIVASVLAAKPGTLIIVDEPGRHLHRSIAAPLLSSLFAEREDCAFVVSTHDVSLPVAVPDASTLLLRSCKWQGKNPIGWDADLIGAGEEIDDDIREVILGAGRRILFIEGNAKSPDVLIYRALYPGISVSPCGGWREVKAAVTGIRKSEQLRDRISAFGLVDGDGRDASEVEKLRTQGIYALEAYSIESLYYCKAMMERIARKQQLAISKVQADLNAAIQSLIDGLRANKEHVCRRIVTTKIREEVLRNLPTHKTLDRSPVYKAECDVAALLEQERKRFDELVAANDIDALVNRYPIRETNAIDNVIKHLGFLKRRQYEMAVCTLLTEDKEAGNILRLKLKGLAEALDKC